MVMFCNFVKGDLWYPFAGQSSREYGLLYPACSLPIHPHSPQLQSYLDWLLPPSQISWIRSPHSSPGLVSLSLSVDGSESTDADLTRDNREGPGVSKDGLGCGGGCAVGCWLGLMSSMSSFLSILFHAPLVSWKGSKFGPFWYALGLSGLFLFSGNQSRSLGYISLQHLKHGISKIVTPEPIPFFQLD